APVKPQGQRDVDPAAELLPPAVAEVIAPPELDDQLTGSGARSNLDAQDQFGTGLDQSRPARPLGGNLVQLTADPTRPGWWGRHRGPPVRSRNKSAGDRAPLPRRRASQPVTRRAARAAPGRMLIRSARAHSDGPAGGFARA